MLFDDVRHTALPRGCPMPPAWDEAVVFNVDAVAQYLHGVRGYYDRREADIPRDFPNVAPLAAAAWFEWTYPYPHPLIMDSGTTRASAMMACVMADREDRAMLDHIAHFSAGRQILETMAARTRWVINVYTVWLVETRTGRELAFLPDVLRVDVAADGHITWLATLSPAGIEELAEGTTARVLGYAEVPLTAICFAHCKGVAITDRQQARQQRRAAERAGRPPLVTYKTIDIAPVTRILREEGDVEHVGIKKALHICRGHFAHYTEDKPLFGKHTGTFYIPMHVRGTAERGAVVKDYRVLATEGQKAAPR